MMLVNEFPVVSISTFEAVPSMLNAGLRGIYSGDRGQRVSDLSNKLVARIHVGTGGGQKH